MRSPAGRRSLAQHRRASASTPKSGRPGALTFGRMVSRSAFVVDVAAVASTTTSGHRRFRSPPAAADEVFVRALPSRSRTHLYQPVALFACRRLLSVRTSDFLEYCTWRCWPRLTLTPARSPRITRQLHAASYLIPPVDKTGLAYCPMTDASRERTRGRLAETGQFVLDVMGCPCVHFPPGRRSVH
jgi:hypothetical protein